MLFALFFLLIGVSVALLLTVYTLFSLLRDRVPYVPTSPWVIRWLEEHLNPVDHATLFDLGCGDGRVLRSLVRRYPTLRAVGFERNWWPYILARWRCRGLPINIRRISFYDADLGSTDVVYCYLLNSVMPRVEAMLQKNLKRGAIVYSYAFRLPTWTPIRTIQNPNKPTGSKLLVYRKEPR